MEEAVQLPGQPDQAQQAEDLEEAGQPPQPKDVECRRDGDD